VYVLCAVGCVVAQREQVATQSDLVSQKKSQFSAFSRPEF
jgi:hypothetical protein